MTITNLRALRDTFDVRVVKASCFGNNFLIYDATDEPLLEEPQFAEFARQVTDPQFGIGADNFLVVQNCSDADLLAINQVHGYWKKLPAARADYIFRMFEPDGTEALCCGNGLMCIANYLAEKLGEESASVMTEIPLARVNQTSIGYTRAKSYGWVNLGLPRRFPAEIGIGGATGSSIGEIQAIGDLRIGFRNHDLHPYSTATELVLNGYLTFTGEPHLVLLLDDEDDPIAPFADAIFAQHDDGQGAGPLLQRRSGFGTWLVDHIGQYLNTHYRELFPAGINVNFARRQRYGDAIEYRCYERGLYRETLACGTGAVAVAFILDHFRDLAGAGIRILPHRCRWYRPDATMAVRGDRDGWVLEGQPDIVAEIDFRFELPVGKAESAGARRAGQR